MRLSTWQKRKLLYLCTPQKESLLFLTVREVAQPGSALGWGSRGRKFESCLPDHNKGYSTE